MFLRFSRLPELLILTVLVAAGLAHLKRPLTLRRCASVAGRVAGRVIEAARGTDPSSVTGATTIQPDPMVAATDYRSAQVSSGGAPVGASAAQPRPVTPGTAHPAPPDLRPVPALGRGPSSDSTRLTRGQSPAEPPAPAPLTAPSAVESASNAPATAPPAPSDDPAQRELQAVADQLRTAGARYYRLESWGTSGALYRFQCWMSMATDGPQRYFEATDEVPLAAMQEVARQVRDWRRTE